MADHYSRGNFGDCDYQLHNHPQNERLVFGPEAFLSIKLSYPLGGALVRFVRHAAYHRDKIHPGILKHNQVLDRPPHGWEAADVNYKEKTEAGGFTQALNENKGQAKYTFSVARGTMNGASQQKSNSSIAAG